MTLNEFTQLIKWLLTCFFIALLMRPYLRVKNLKFLDGGFFLSLGLGLALSFFLSWIFSATLNLPFDERFQAVPIFLGLVPLYGKLRDHYRAGFEKRKRGQTDDDFKQWRAGLLKKEEAGHKNNPLKQIAGAFYSPQWKNFLTGFGVFALLFILTVWVRGYKIGVECTTEQYMDFGFVQAIFRQKSAVPEDIWFSGNPLNYYYLGQACTAYLCRLSRVVPDFGYTFMLATVYAACIGMVFSIVQGFLSTILGRTTRSVLTGSVIGSLAAAFSGNGHYLLHGIILPLVGKITGQDLRYRPEGYFFPDSTVYVGNWPDLADKGKNEFLAYSVILGDLHAHYVNQLFVLPLLVFALDYALDPEKKTFAARLLDVRYFLIATLLAIFMGANYWDFPIYYVICGALILFHDLALYAPGKVTCKSEETVHSASIAVKRLKKQEAAGGTGNRENIILPLWRIVAEVLGKGVLIFGVAKLLIQPFERQFVKMASEICLAHAHTQFYKFVVLWGIPITISAALFIHLMRGDLKKQFPLGRLAIICLILCATGLTLVPEAIFIRDIYGDEFARFNTMFKLTYQAFLLFSIITGIAVGIWLQHKKLAFALPAIVVTALLSTYLFTAIHQFMGNVLIPSNREGANVCDFLLKDADLSAEMTAIHLLREDPRRVVHILEAGGESYTPDDKLSVFSGACTYVGWSVHEWMWRSSYDIIGPRMDETSRFYQGGDKRFCENFVKDHEIDYIFAGPQEYGQYAVDLSGFEDLCDVVFCDENGYALYKVR